MPSSHRSRLARAVQVRTGRPYAQCLEQVHRVVEQGLLPPFAALDEQHGVDIVTASFDEPSAGPEQPGLDGMVARVRAALAGWSGDDIAGPPGIFGDPVPATVDLSGVPAGYAAFLRLAEGADLDVGLLRLYDLEGLERNSRQHVAEHLPPLPGRQEEWYCFGEVAPNPPGRPAGSAGSTRTASGTPTRTDPRSWR